MEEHYFNKKVAKVVGVNAAIIFHNIQHWCDYNEKNKKNFHDGEYWTFNSLNAFTEQFYYLSKKQITSALDKLKDNGFIGYGEYNTNPYDRTRWYCDLTKKHGLNMFLSMVTKGDTDVPKMGHVEDDKRYTSITNINTDINTDNKHLNIITEQSSVGQTEIELSDEPVAKKEMTLYQKFIEVWLKEFKIGWKFTATDGVKMKSMIKNIERSLKNHNSEITDDTMVNLFRHFLAKLPQFYKSQSLSVLESKYDSIIDEIKNGKQPTYQSTSANVAESINFFANL